MKTAFIFLASALCLGIFTPRARADKLDDMIAAMRNGAAAPADKKEIMKTMGVAAQKTFADSIADMYLLEVKFSIIDSENNGGWPYRSFLVEEDPVLRNELTKALEERYKGKPDPILAYALICPAIYADDAALVDRLHEYLKDNDPFLYKLEQAHIDKYWRPYAAAVKKLILAPQLLCKMLPYIASNGVDRELAAVFANPLGLSTAGATWSYRGIGIHHPDAEHIYGFGISRGADPDVLLSHRMPDSIHVFRANRDGTVIKALTFSVATKQVTMINPTEAQAEFDTDWNLWSDEIDDLVAATGVK